MVWKWSLFGHPGKRLYILIVQVSWETELFNSVELYLEASLEMAQNSAVTLGRNFPVIVDSFNSLEMYAFICNLMMYLYDSGNLMTALENGLKR